MTALTTPSARLKELGIELPPTPKPLATYAPASRFGDLVFTSGQLPLRDGQLLAAGLVGEGQIAEDDAVRLARVATLNALAAVQTVSGDIDAIQQILKVTVFVASAAGFHGQPKIADGASRLLRDIFSDRGVHARSAVGVASLPLGAPVEVELAVGITSS